MSNYIEIDGRKIGDGYPCYVIAEIGINHNGDLDVAKQLVAVAHRAGCDAVKFQKRTPEQCVPKEQRDLIRETPWGTMTYMEYRERVEFGQAEYQELDRYCAELGIHWFVSVWDVESVDFMEPFAPVCYKIPSAALTHGKLLTRLRETGRSLILSTGMSTPEEIRRAVDLLGDNRLALAHATSIYPCAPSQLNLRVIQTLKEQYDCPIGYSGHEVGLAPTCAAVAMGATFVERHITLDRAMWGSDQAASVEPQGIERLVRNIRVIEVSTGDGNKVVYPQEAESMRRLRWNNESLI